MAELKVEQKQDWSIRDDRAVLEDWAWYGRREGGHQREVEEQFLLKVGLRKCPGEAHRGTGRVVKENARPQSKSREGWGT